MEDKSCYNGCKFYDERNECCMYKFDCRALLYQRKNCENYQKGIFSYDELEKTNYQ